MELVEIMDAVQCPKCNGPVMNVDSKEKSK